MSTVTQFNSKESIRATACLWVSRLDRGLSAAEKREFVAWVNTSVTHREIMFELAKLWDDLSVLNELSALFPLEEKKPKPRMLPRYAMAAGVLFAVLMTGGILNQSFPTLLGGNNGTLVADNLYETSLGQQASYHLSDGTSVHLNTNSKILVDFSASKRLITLVRGEAKFSVAKDKFRPFTVTSGNKSFTALGTIFNVQKNADDDMELLVTEGRVLITESDEILNDISEVLSQLAPEQLPGTVVSNGEKAVIEDNIESPVLKVSLEESQRDLAWQQGTLVFQGESLEQALRELERYSTTKFVITDPKLANLKVAGYYRAGDNEQMLKSLNRNFNIVAERIDQNTIQLKRIDS